jgi:hypothetical protein
MLSRLSYLMLSMLSHLTLSYPGYLISSYVMLSRLSYSTLLHLILCYVTSSHFIFYYPILSYSPLLYVIQVILSYVINLTPRLSYLILFNSIRQGYIMLCYVILFCFVLSCLILGWGQDDVRLWFRSKGWFWEMSSYVMTCHLIQVIQVISSHLILSRLSHLILPYLILSLLSYLISLTLSYPGYLNLRLGYVILCYLISSYPGYLMLCCLVFG